MTAIKELHEVKIIHCDIKPQNIMIKFTNSGDFLIFLIDFGLS